jgi:hypothetical protein
MTLAEAWERDFHGGQTKDKLDSAFYEELKILDELREERNILVDIYDNMEA